MCEGENPGDLVYIREGCLRDVNRECLCWTTVPSMRGRIRGCLSSMRERYVRKEDRGYLWMRDCL